MPHGYNKIQQLEEVYDSLIHHLFLPCYLPNSAEADFCLRSNHRNEYFILDYMKDFLQSFHPIDNSKIRSAFHLIVDCIERWWNFQKIHHPSVTSVQSMMVQLPIGGYFPMYFHAQNAAILINIDEEREEQAYISAWPVLLPTKLVASSMQYYSSSFPATTYRLSNRTQLNSTIHCELLIDFMKNTIEYPKSYRGAREVDEIRDVPVSDYVCHWWIQHFEGITSELPTNDSIKFNKKHRDQVRWSTGKLPFRRSGLWMTIKVVLQTILTKHLGNLGCVVYKLLITQFLTYVIYMRSVSACSPVATDLSIHCLRKIIRRLNKIEHLLASIDTQTVQSWIEQVKHQIQEKVDEIMPKTNWQFLIRTKEEQKYQQLYLDVKLLYDKELYRHSFEALNKYLNSKKLNESNQKSHPIRNGNDMNDTSIAHEEDMLVLSSFHKIHHQYQTTVGVAITRMEIEILAFIDRWMDQGSVMHRETEHFKILSDNFNDYHEHALNHYCSKSSPSDPIGYSRYLLISLSIIRTMHEKLCSDARFERLKIHRILRTDVLKLFEYLILPYRDDMVRARNLYDYFNQWRTLTNPDLLTDIAVENSFGVYYATHSNKINNVLRKIQDQAEKDKAAKVQEVRTAKEKYHRLMNSIAGCPCTCYDQVDDRLCRRCRIEETANNIKVNIYENPIPSDIHSAMAVIFELRMPIEIRYYRDILWQFENRSQKHSLNRWYEWLRIHPHSSKLQPYFTGPNDYKVKLVSSINSMQHRLKTNPSISSATVDDFLFENSLEVEISPIQLFEPIEEYQILTPRLDHPDYKDLQYTIATTDDVQNRVIASLAHIESKLKPRQIVEFGSMRSGHRLQWWNILAMFESDTLSLNEESVTILITHTILQYGPILENSDLLTISWCPEAHQQLVDYAFVEELILRLHRRLDDCTSNWQNELTLLIIVLITMRILIICNPAQQDKIVNLTMRCRRVGEQWINMVSSRIHRIASLHREQMENLRHSLVVIAIACLLTFATQPSFMHRILNTNQHIISLLKAATTIHDHSITNKEQDYPTTFLRDMIRYGERVLVLIQPILEGLLRKLTYTPLSDFIHNHWASAQHNYKTDISWRKRHKNPSDGWYDGEYKTTKLSIDCIQGIFLVNGMSVSYLPEKVFTNALYRRVFGDYIFPVQLSDSYHTYITKYSYHQGKRIKYEFSFNDQLNRLIIHELNTETGEVYELIPSEYFEDDLPASFVLDYSHWQNQLNQIIEFRPIHFSDPDFFDHKPYLLNIDTGIITTNHGAKSQIMINRSSIFFRNLFSLYFMRLDDSPYVYMLSDNTSDITVFIHLSRLKMAFEYDVQNQCFTSREYPTMCIARNQWLGTFTGLNSGLLLSYKSDNTENQNHLKFRKLIIPFGHLLVRKLSLHEHQNVIVERKSTMMHAQQYFVYVLNDRLRIIQPSESPAGWLYLALLHATTSHSLPDDYTGMTGMERAFQLLNSAGSWSDRPLDSLSLNVLHQISALSPRAKFIRQDSLCMQTIEWNSQTIPYSMQHFGYYLIAQAIIHNSEKLKFMHPSSRSNDVLTLSNDKEDYDEHLLIKLYWDYRPWQNMSARLSVELETEMRSSINQLDNSINANQGSIIKNQDQKAYPIHDMYHSGDVRLKNMSELTCFPLNKWLSEDLALNTAWIGLLQLAETLKLADPTNKANRDDRDRLLLLLDFLHYVSPKCDIRRHYIQILGTVLNSPNLSVSCLAFPPFTQYNNIQQVTVTPSAIGFHASRSASERRVMIEEIKSCLKAGTMYKDQCRLATSEEKQHIKLLLKSWHLNQKLQGFLDNLQNLISSSSVEPWRSCLSVLSQQLINHPIDHHYQSKRIISSRFIDQELLSKAKAIYFEQSDTDFCQILNTSTTTEQMSREFPEDIFSSTSSDIGNFFKSQLRKSWQHWQCMHLNKRNYPTCEKIFDRQSSYRQESDELWHELIECMTHSNERLFSLGLLPRLSPFTLISLFYQIWLNESEKKDLTFLTEDECLLLGGTMVSWVNEQHIERVLTLASQNQWDEYMKELENTPHANWSPAENLPWLIFELEMNITIRKTQIDVAKHIMQNGTSKDDELTIENRVMQMNMGEGKTSIIIPMLALSLSARKSSLVRVIVLKALLQMNYHLLKCKLGGLLNRRIFPFTCRRDLDFDHDQMNTILKRLRTGLRYGDVVLASPEDILSFDLLTIDKCRRHDFQTGQLMLNTHSWCKSFVQDILDESDEILHCKYQLIYTVGTQQTIDGNMERWKLIQTILDVIRSCAQNIVNDDPTNVYYRAAERQSGFPEIRLLSYESFPKLCIKIVHTWLVRKQYRKIDRQYILSFILDVTKAIDILENRFPAADQQTFLILRGLLSGEVLYVALQKRYRVNYGINPNPKFNRLMAVPFRAKDVPTERTEFGHPDIALVLTQLSYYYRGLDDSQVLRCLDRVSGEERNPESIYAEWIAQDNEYDIPRSLRQWKGVNLKDCQQENHEIFLVLRHNTAVINYFLNHFVFPREAKQFPQKLVASAWDLSSPLRTKNVTGFSGTNDTQLLLPVHIHQRDLPQLLLTDALVLNHLLQPDNEHYQSLPMNASSKHILQDIVHFQPTINVILDVGALFIDGINRQVAIDWLMMSNRTSIDYAIYFESDCIMVCDRQYHHSSFYTSPASERLDRCVIYMDEVHTRGTDFRFPNGFKAAVTLGNGLTKDHFVQACMRMRKLGSNHSLAFWSSDEVHQQVLRLKPEIPFTNNSIQLKDILRWVYKNTEETTWDGLLHWSNQSLSYQRKVNAFQNLPLMNHEQLYEESVLRELAEKCLEPEVLQLQYLYGKCKTWQTILEIYLNRYQHDHHHVSEGIHDAVSHRLSTYGGLKKRLAHSFDEEQQRELEQELEQEQEREQEHQNNYPQIIRPCQPILHDQVKQLCRTDVPTLDLNEFPHVFLPIAHAFIGSTFSDICQIDCWSPNLWISSEFQRVIENKDLSLDQFLRLPRWILFYRNEHIILINTFEANWLMGQLQTIHVTKETDVSCHSTLRLLLPRSKLHQSIFVNTATLTIPQLITPVTVPNHLLSQLFILNGTIYFENTDEQRSYCHCLALCPKPWCVLEENAFEDGWIETDGFVPNPEHRIQLSIEQARFKLNPLSFVKQLVRHRQNTFISWRSHVGSIIFNATKMLMD